MACQLTALYLIFIFFSPGFKDVQLSCCWVTCISRQSKLGKGGQSECKTLPPAKVPFLAWLPSVVLLPTMLASPGRTQAAPSNWQHQQRKTDIFPESRVLKQC